ncbi:MAG TPA: sulfur carrier protein ThiS [Acidimicrobiales bacterium]|nr:sulfur carrier protein ThiS [Acidimicrobiales bacterium]
MKIVVNGEPRVLDDGTTVHTLAVAVLDRPTGVAVAVNGEVVPRSAWARTALRDDDRVEVVTARQGG